MSIEQLYSEILMEHNTTERNRHHLDSPTIVLKGLNPSCGDEISLELKIENNTITDASFTGSGCAISQASTSIMIDLIRGKTAAEAQKLATAFFQMIKTGEVGPKILDCLEEAQIFKNISTMPARVKCAVLPWHTFSNALKKV